MVSRYRREGASPLHQRGKNFTGTRIKLSNTLRSSLLVPDYESHFEETDRTYSYLSATTGSTLVARRAGMQHAKSATAVSNSVIRMKVSGSVALTPNSRLFINCVSATE